MPGQLKTPAKIAAGLTPQMARALGRPVYMTRPGAVLAALADRGLYRMFGDWTPLGRAVAAELAKQ